MRYPILLVVLATVGSAIVHADTTVPAKARSLYDKAEVAREEGRLEEAVLLYKQAIEAHPTYWAAHAGFQAAMRGTGDRGLAPALYEKLIAEHPDAVDLKVYQAAALDVDDAIKALTKLCADYPDNARAFLELGRKQLAAGDDKDAERTLKDAVKKAGDNDTAPYVVLGHAYFAVQRYTKARNSYRDAREIDKSCIPAILGEALCDHRQGKSDEALLEVARLVADDNLPRLVAGWWILAVIRVDLEKYDDAVAAFDKILEIDKDDYLAMIAKGQVLLQQKKPVEAASIFAKVVEKNPNSGEALFCLGWAHETSADAPEIQDAQRKERLAKAAEAYEKAAGLDPSARPRDSLGFVHLLGDNFREAVMQFKRARDLDPSYAPAMNNLGLSDDIADNRSAAKDRYEQVLKKVDKENVRAHVMLALDLWLDGSHPKAVRELEKALKIDPNDSLAWTFLGDVHYDNGKADRAIRAYRSAVKVDDNNFRAWFHMGIALDDDKRKYEDAADCYEKAHQATVNPPLDLLLRLGGINDLDLLDRPEKALQYYQAYKDAGGTEEWVDERIADLKDLMADK